jgi:hypothetical protein
MDSDFIFMYYYDMLYIIYILILFVRQTFPTEIGTLCSYDVGGIFI